MMPGGDDMSPSPVLTIFGMIMFNMIISIPIYGDVFNIFQFRHLYLQHITKNLLPPVFKILLPPVFKKRFIPCLKKEKD